MQKAEREAELASAPVGRLFVRLAVPAVTAQATTKITARLTTAVSLQVKKTIQIQTVKAVKTENRRTLNDT